MSDTPENQQRVEGVKASPPTALFAELIDRGWTVEQCAEHWWNLGSMLQTGIFFATMRPDDAGFFIGEDPVMPC
ncbi:MAG: hypothetical protein ABIJ09_16075 [Pseudomonadota bacterium]